MNIGRIPLVCALAAFIAMPAGLRAAELVAHWTFENAPDLGADSSGMGNHADNVSSVTQVAGWAGSGGFFDEGLGSNFIKSGGLAGFSGATGQSFAAWVKLAPGSSGFDGIISQDSGGCCETRILLQQNDKKPYINLSEHSDRHLSGAPSFVADQWMHIAMTGENVGAETIARVYVDGVEVAGSPQSFPLAADASGWNTYLGVGESGTAHRMTGTLDEVRVYEGVLTPEEIQGLLSLDIDSVGLDALIHYPGPEDPVVLSTAAPGTAVGELLALNEFGSPIQGAVFTLVPGAGDADNSGYSIDGSTLEVLADNSGLDNVPQTIRVEAEGPDNTVEGVLTFTVVADDDNDGLIDDWEETHGSTGDFFTGNDHDEDGLNDEDEFALGTDPDDPDTDDDFSIDGDEVDNGTDPFDEDSDDDTLLDGHETNTGIFNSPTDTGSDPLDPDTDGDFTNDGDEIPLGRDPTIPDAPAPDSLDDDLTAYYTFDGDSLDQAHALGLPSSTVADDLSPASGHPGTLGTGLFGGGGYLGSGPGTGHFETPDSADVDPNINTGEITVSWWARHAAPFSAGWQCGVAKGEANNWRFHRTNVGSTISWQGGGGDINSLTGGLDDGNWHHFVGTKEADGTRNLYVNGALETTGAAGTPITDSATPMMVGENPEADGREWNGEIDDVAIWRRALSPAEIQGLYNEGIAGSSLLDIIGGAGLGLRIREVSYAPPPAGPNGRGEITITWSSREGRNYAVFWNQDLVTPFQDLNDFEDADPGETTTRTYELPPDPGDGVSPITDLFFVFVEEL